jgi:cell wall-associated NlpC family hydrolase
MVQQLCSIQRLLCVTAAFGIVFTVDQSQHQQARRAQVSSVTGVQPVSSAFTRTPASKSINPGAMFEGFNQLPRAVRDSIVRLAQAQLGARYEYGGTSPDLGFDCSGLVRYVLAQVHFSLPRTAHQQARIGTPIHRDLLKPGDLLTFGTADSVSHIGIYIGDGKYVHASSVAGRVIISSLDRPLFARVQPLSGARRLYANANPFANRKS